jgi:predicted transposase YdaD
VLGQDDHRGIEGLWHGGRKEGREEGRKEGREEGKEGRGGVLVVGCRTLAWFKAGKVSEAMLSSTKRRIGGFLCLPMQ